MYKSLQCPQTTLYSHLYRYAKCGSRVHQCLFAKLTSTLPAVSRTVNKAEPAAASVPLETVESRVDHHGPIKQEPGSSSAEYSASSAVAEDSASTPRAQTGQQGTESRSDQQAPRQCTPEQNRKELHNEISTDKLFSLDEDDIKELRHSSFSDL